MITQEAHIKVLNFSGIKTCVEGRTRGYVFEPARDNVPSLHLMTFEDIEYINSRSPIFRTGGLRFDKDREAEIFDALTCPGWRDTLISEDDIMDIIFNSTIKNQERIISIKDVSTIERIRGQLVICLNQELNGISTRNAGLINDRFKELCENKINSQLIVKDVSRTDDEVEQIKVQNANLHAELEEMKKLLSSLIEQKNASQIDASEPSQPTPTTAAEQSIKSKAARGRKPENKE